MTTPTSEQVVQWAMSVGINNFGLNELAPYPTVDQYSQLITLARADIEATIAELQQQVDFWQKDRQELQQKDDVIIAEQAVELESLRKDAARWNWWKREGKVYPMRDDDNNLVICSIPITFFGGSKFSTVLEAIDADITELSQQEK